MDEAFTLEKKLRLSFLIFKDSKVYSFVNLFRLFRGCIWKKKLGFSFSSVSPIQICLYCKTWPLAWKTMMARKRYGNILSFMKVKVDSMTWRVLSYFYDPTYHCFTFLDYQLSPTLEEFAYLVESQSMIRFFSFDEKKNQSPALLGHLCMFQRSR